MEASYGDDLHSDYNALVGGTMDKEEFSSKHGVRVMAKFQTKTDHGWYDCERHANLLLDAIHEDGAWTVDEEQVPWEDARYGDIVKWGRTSTDHYGVVIKPSTREVESCWGSNKYVFRHPVDVSIYDVESYGEPRVYPVRSERIR